MSIPTETKNTAAKTSRTGSTRCSTVLATPDSATRAPPRKAPSATEKPNLRASSAEAKQMPMLATTVVSGRPILTRRRTSRGTTSMPTTSRPTRNPSSLPMVSARAKAERPTPDAAAVTMATSRMAIRSSTMRIPRTSSFRPPSIFCSAKALTMMVVLEMATRAPVNRLS
jgi:hypothetical protein